MTTRRRARHSLAGPRSRLCADPGIADKDHSNIGPGCCHGGEAIDRTQMRRLLDAGKQRDQRGFGAGR